VIWRNTDTATLAYSAPPGTHVILDATDTSQLTAKPSAGGCAITVTNTASGILKPLVARVDASCNVIADPEASAASAVGTRPVRARPVGTARAARSGCCSAEAAPGQSFAMVLVVGALLRRRRRITAS
jgi:MYXO-CTERM domain-containing protein